MSKYYDKLNDYLWKVHALMNGLHTCHICGMNVIRMNGRGEQRHFCSKYGLTLNKVKNSCLDRFPFFNKEEIDRIIKQWKSGGSVFVINGEKEAV